MTPNDSSSPLNETSKIPDEPYAILQAEPVSLQALARSVQGPEWRAMEALLGLERLKHLECLANPALSNYWGAHRAIANWIMEFTTIMRENLIAVAEDQRKPRTPAAPEAPGTPYMEHTSSFDETDLPIPAPATEAL